MWIVAHVLQYLLMISRRSSVNVCQSKLSSVSKSAILSGSWNLHILEFSVSQIGSHLYKWVNQTAFHYSSKNIKSRIALNIGETSTFLWIKKKKMSIERCRIFFLFIIFFPRENTAKADFFTVALEHFVRKKAIKNGMVTNLNWTIEWVSITHGLNGYMHLIA